MLQIQRAMPSAMMAQQRCFPKLVISLTEEEYDAMALDLEVNSTYDVAFENGTIAFTKEHQEPNQA